MVGLAGPKYPLNSKTGKDVFTVVLIVVAPA